MPYVWLIALIERQEVIENSFFTSVIIEGKKAFYIRIRGVVFPYNVFKSSGN
jgi:hypothetical protein